MEYGKYNTEMDNGCTTGIPRPFCDHNSLNTLVTMIMATSGCVQWVPNDLLCDSAALLCTSLKATTMVVQFLWCFNCVLKLTS